LDLDSLQTFFDFSDFTDHYAFNIYLLPLSQVSIGSKELRGSQAISVGLTGFGCDFPNVLNPKIRINDHHCDVLIFAIKGTKATDQGLPLGTRVVSVDPCVKGVFLLGYFADDFYLTIGFGNVAPVVVVEEVNHIFHCG
jgi:hypothetical protein